MNKDLEKEITYCNSSKEFTLGKYLYMGMAKLEGQTVCISVGYKPDYAIKKAKEFVHLLDNKIHFYKINKVKVGELEACAEFRLD